MVAALHTTLVVAFVLVTGLLFVLTLVHRLRVQRVMLSWRTTSPGTTPAWPILFIGMVSIMFVYAMNTGSDVPVLVFSGYLAGGILWLASSIISSGVLVTDIGIVRDLGRSGGAVAWIQIGDYFEVRKGRRVHFVFMFTAADGSRRRMQVVVPPENAARFRRIVRAHLDDRMDTPVLRTVGRQAMEE